MVRLWANINKKKKQSKNHAVVSTWNIITTIFHWKIQNSTPLSVANGFFCLSHIRKKKGRRGKNVLVRVRILNENKEITKIRTHHHQHYIIKAWTMTNSITKKKKERKKTGTKHDHVMRNHLYAFLCENRTSIRTREVSRRYMVCVVNKLFTLCS